MNELSTSVKSETAYSFIRTKLASGEYAPGERLVESRIARELNLSRVPVREALQQLENEGLVESLGVGRSRAVRYIEEMSSEDAISHFEAREAIEGMAARLAAKNMTGWQIDGLRDIATRYEAAAVDGSNDQTARLALSFHRYLLSNCGNSRLLAIWEDQDLALLCTRNSDLGRLILSGMPADRDIRSEFAPIVEAVAAHDPDKAERVMREFIGSMKSAVRRALAERSEEESA